MGEVPLYLAQKEPAPPLGPPEGYERPGRETCVYSGVKPTWPLCILFRAGDYRGISLIRNTHPARTTRHRATVGS